MSIQSTTTTSLSKEMSVEESYSKTTTMSSSTMESSSSKSSTIISGSLTSGDSGISSLTSKIDSDLAITDGNEGLSKGMKLASMEKSSSIEQSEGKLSMSKSEVSKSLEIEESSTMKSSKEEVSMSKSEMTSEVSITKSESISSEVSEEKPSVYVAVMDYSPRPGDTEGIPITEGQEVEVIDSSKAHKWRVKLRQDGTEGTVPSCYLEKKTTSTPPISPQLDAKAQAAMARREKVLKELVESEEAFSRDMQYVVNNYIKEMESKTMSKELKDYKDVLFSNFKAISEFHNNVLMKGIQYYADDPARLGKTFLRLERDFDMHVTYCRDEPEAQQLLQEGPLKEYFDEFSKKIQDEKSLSEHLKLPIQRINDYQLLLKELIKYTARLKENTVDLEKAHDFMQAIPQRIADLQYINSIQGYKGNLHKLGRILKHDWFEVTDGHGLRRERFAFLFKGRIFITDHKKVGNHRSIYLVKNVIKLPDVEIVDNADDDDLKIRFQSLKPGLAGFPLTLKSKKLEQKDDWLNTIQVSSAPHVEDLGEDEEEFIEEQAAKVEEFYEKHETKVEVVEDFEAYEEMHTVVTESMRSGSLTSLEDFHSALEDEASLCITVSDMESGGPGRPRFIVPLKAQTCAEGVEVVLECDVCASPEANVAWLKDNAPFESTHRASLEADEGKHRLLIKKAECVDSGLYTIIASNMHGTTSCSASLTVSSALPSLPPTTPDGSLMPYGPIFREKLRNTELQVGTDFRVCVIVEGEPKPNVKFYKGDEEIHTTGRVRFHQEDKECFELIIDNVAMNDAGKYSCVATSSAGQNVTCCDISVTSAKVFVKIDEDPDRTSTPEILDETIQWGKDIIKEAEAAGKEVEASERFKVSIDDSEDTIALVFQKVTPDDAGMHTCVASTSTGKISCSAELTVQGGLPRDPEAPKVSAATKTVNAKEGESAMLELTATGFPKPVITWTKDGEDLKLGDKYVVLQEDDETYTMAIKNITSDDSGKYAAEAINDLGKDDITYDLKVTSPPKFIKPMKDTSTTLGEDAEFSVEVDGSPEPTVTWSKDGQQLTDTDRIKIVSDGKTKKLLIKKAQVEDKGNYSCIIKNENGSQGGFGALKVNSPAKFTKALSDVACRASEDASFSVAITGSPTPSIKWLKDGAELKVDGAHVIQKEEKETNYTLTIKKTSKTDEGEYTCEVTNQHGKDTSKGKLAIKEKAGFKKGLNDVSASEGEDIKFNVKLTGSPKPTVKWAKDGNDLTIDDKHVELKVEEDGDSLTLIVHKSTVEDAGKYECTVTNSEGSETTSSKVTVKATEKAPSFIKELKDVSVKEGETVEFTVKFSGKPKIKWNKDGAELKIDSKHFEYKKEDVEDSLTLVLNKATPADTGKYSCTISNDAGSATTSSNLVVSADETAPSFQKGLKDKTVKEEETVSFNVKFSGKPKPEAKWQKDGAELKIDNKHLELRYEEDGDSLTLVLNKATKDDSGTYSCIISNSVGSDTTKSKLEVKADETAPSFQKGLTDKTVKEEENVSFNVKFSGKPKPEVKWQKDGAELKIDNKHLELRYEEDGDSLTLVLNKATKDDSGTYSCIISNSVGSETTKSKLVVKADETAPSFQKGLTDKTVKEDETVSFNVKFSGKPKPEAKWQKDGAELKIDNKHLELRYEEDGDSLTLVLNKATKDDFGTYSCIISNSAGSETTKSKLEVKADVSSPSFQKGLKDQSVEEEELVFFNVKFSGKPKPDVKWNKDGAELQIDKKKFELRYEEDGDSLTLVLNKATKEDAGKYTCVISNSEGSDTTSSKLDVTESQKSPSFSKELENVTTTEDESIELTVKYEGNPRPEVKWQKDGSDIKIDDDHYELKKEKDSETLIINDVTTSDSGKYTCVISNSAGSLSTNSDVTVKEETSAPKFIKGLKDLTVKEELAVKYTVKFSGKPKPTVKWTKDGADLPIDGSRVKSITETDDSVSIIINDAKKEDCGTYTCTIANLLGSESTSSNLNVSESSYSPEFTLKLKDKEVKEGADAEFFVKFTGKPKPEAKWTFDDEDLIIDNKHIELKVEEDGTSMTLIIHGTTKDDAGKYGCILTSPLGTQTCKAKLMVSVPPLFTKTLGDVEAEEGAPLRLNVKFEGQPDPAVIWKKDGVMLEMDAIHFKTTIENDESVTLVIEKLKKENAGTYFCEITNPQGSASTSGKVTVTGKPIIKKGLSDKEIIDGETNVELTVEVTGTPFPEGKCYFNGKEVSEGDTFKILKDESKHTYKIILKKMSTETVGEVKFEASNSGGKVETKGKLNLLNKPNFIKTLSDQTVVEGDALKLETTVSGKPAPDVKWYFGKQELKTDDHRKIVIDGVNHALLIEESAVEDSGSYSCKAISIIGEISQKAAVTVKSRKDTQAPMFITHLYDQVIVIRDAARMEVKLSGKPEPEVTWFRGEEELNENDCVIIKKDSDTSTYSLTLKNLKISDSSKYSCKAINKYGEASESSHLTVKEPVAPHIEELGDSEVRYGAPARLTAKITGFPIPEIKWLKDDVPLSNKDSCEIISDAKIERYTISIKSVRNEEVGRYLCIAKNSAGEAKAEGKLTIKAQMPAFVKDIPDQSIDMGEKFSFEAEIYGFPAPEVSWFKDNKPLESNSNYKILKDGDIYKLQGTIKSVEDAGVIMCKAKNPAGEDFRKANLKVSDFAPILLEKLPLTIDLTEGDKLTLKTKVIGKPVPEIKWCKDGKILRHSGKLVTSMTPDGVIELNISDVTHDDAGNYKLVVSNEKGQSAVESSISVAFKAKNSKPFVSQLHELDVVTGNPILLEAKVTGNPKPKIEWFKDDNRLESGDHIKLSEKDNKAILSVESAKIEDSGEYKLTATNELGDDSSSTVISVSVPGKKPTITKELKAVKLLEGEEKKLEIIVTGYPKPVVAWMHNGKNVLEGQHCTISSDDNGLCTLTIHEVKCEDGGMYSAIASNKHGKAVTEAPFIVSPVPKKEVEKKPTKVFEFLQSLMPQLVAEGKPCDLQAKVTTDPKPISIKWTKDGKEVSPSDCIELSQDSSGLLKLHIDHLTPADRGKYAVIVTDGNTEIKSEALINMMPTMPGMSGNKPYFIKGLEPLKVGEGGTIKLQAQLSTDSECKIKWMRNGDDVVKSDRIQMLEQPNGAIALIVEAAVPEDSGKYVVVATNEEGKTRSSAMVAVVGVGFKLPEIVDSLKSTPFIQGETGKLTAKVNGEPMPEVKWLRDGVPIEPTDRIKMIQNPDGTVVLEISNIKPEDAGKYTLLISNLGGETRSSANVEVIQSPLFVKPLQPATGVSGCPVQLECKISGDPIPDIKWTKDGVEIPDDDLSIRKRHLPSGEVSLIFDKCKPENAGEYTCTASNKHGEKSSNASLNIISKEIEGQQKSSPAFVSPLNDLKVEEGVTFRLEATISGNPLPDIQWFLDDQPVSCSDSISLAFDGKKAILTVYRCNAHHEGVYECKISNSQGKASSKGKVTILTHEPPEFIERLYDMQFLTNEPMKLNCQVKGIPSPIVEWYFNRQKVEQGIKYTVLHEGEKCSLTIPHPRIKDSGIYECRARNDAGKNTCSASISVINADAEGESPMFLKKLKDSSVLNGMTAKLTACICGKPKPEVKWFKDGVQLSPNSRYIMEADSNGVIRLIIRGAQKSDIGTYRVSIANKFGSETCTAALDIEGEDKPKMDMPKKEISKPIIQGPPSPLPHAPYIFKMTDDGASLGWRPAIPQFPHIPNIYRLEMCKIPDGQWSTYKTGIKDSSCDIKDLLPGTDYMFRVRVENKYGASEPSPYITAHRTRLYRALTPVDHVPKDYELERLKLDKYAAAPRFLRLDEDSTYAVRGHPARIEFWVYGCPQPEISWYFNNTPVEHEKYDFLEDRNGQVIMFITRMNDEDVGTYTCKAVNEHGEAERKIKLMIAEPPIFTKRLDPVTTMVRKGGEFKCKIIGIPYPKVKWFKDWHPLSESSRIHIKLEEPDNCTLTLSDSILKDGGLYTCTATNVAGTSTSSAMLTVEECEDDYQLLTYQKLPFVKSNSKPFEDFYDVGDELGRGTQGITYHVVERKNGRSLAAKVMHGTGKLMDFMTAEMDIMNQLCHPRLARLWDAHIAKSSVTLAMDICGGGELLPNILHQEKLTETIVAHYIKQILEGLQHMHEKSIAHLGLTIGDILLTRLNCDNIKIVDFGLATHLYPGREFIQEYGHPEFVAPEVANKQPVTLAADMWSVGIITYILLVGDSPFLKENDRETLKEVQKGKADFYHDGFVVLSDEARDFIMQLLQSDPTKRMDVNSALKHKWLELDSIPDICDELSNLDRLREYYRRWKAWYSNASCRWFFRRRTLESCFTHPSRMIYPPDEEYTPPPTPDGELDRSRVKPAAFDDVTYRQKIEREAIDPKSESHYQNGPDTFLLPLRDPDFPVRIRRYLKVGANRSPILARHLSDKHWGYSDVAVKERRKFVDVMDEEITDEKKGLSRSANLRLRHEVGTPGSGYEHLEIRCQKKKRGFRGTSGTAPFFREKINHAVIRENEDAEFNCRVTASPDAQVSWFRNDGILIESSRIIISKWSDGRCSLILRPAKAYDMGVYKCVARNDHGFSICRARLSIGSVSVKPDPPKADRCSDTEIFLKWAPPKFDGYSPTFGYALEYKEESAENWTKIANNIAHEFYLVRNLIPSTTYYFHICAVNKFGWSEFSLPSEPILTLTEAAPKIELSRAEKFQQDQTDNGQELILDSVECLKLDYDREDEPITLEEAEPTEIYNYISEVARGRFSLVMKVWHKKVNAAFVAKAIAITDNSAHKEIELYKSLQHEKIANLHSASVSKTSLFLVMEKLSGIDVLTYLSSKPLYTEDLVSRIIKQVIDGLEYLHFRGICYFELQPDNVVMIDRHHPNIKLVDFGCAEYVPDEGAKINVKGSLEYLAPEVVKGEDVHSPADIWGIGVLTYILLSGFSPFAGETNTETKDNVLYVRYHFDHLYKEVTPEATHFLMQLFKRTPQKRPTTEECLENKWLLPNEFMIKKREHAVFLSHTLRDFSEHFHSLKGRSTPNALLNIFGKSEAR